jgi:putative tributyrin esterase
MKAARRLFLLLALLLPLAAHAQTVATARVETVNFESKLIGQALPYHVVLPLDYNAPAARTTRYPVLYLLHGLAGSHDDWVSTKAHLAQYAAQYRIIIVTPEGHDGWYTDGVAAPNEKYESYIVQELLPDVDGRYRTIAERKGRALAGLSMGGYGALKFGVKYPDKFIFVASMSGALGAPAWDVNSQELIDFVKPSIAHVYGAMNNPVRAANDIFKLYDRLTPAESAQLPYIYLDCGTEDFLLDSNRTFAALLLNHKIPHEFRELPGQHEWPYWDQQVQEVLRIAARRLAPPH